MIVLVAVLMSALLGFAALAVDMSVVYLDVTRMQNALDASVLAGAALLPDTAAATAEAKRYFSANGGDANAVTYEFSGDNMVITGRSDESRPALFSNIFGNQALESSADATAEKYVRSLGGPFDYLLFSGSSTHTFNMGGRFTINGSVHSNGSVSISPSTGVVTGAVEGCNSVYVNQWTASVGSEIEGADYIEMVDFTDAVDGVIPDSFETTLEANAVNAEWRYQTFTGNTYINGNASISNGCVINGNMYVNGNFTVNGGSPAAIINGSIYATGNITFNNTAEVNGCVFAGGDITFNGGGLYLNSSSEVCIYSETGDVSFNCASSAVTGVVYAPQGNVRIVGNNTTFYGSIIGYTVTGIPANLVMRPPTEPLSYIKSEESIRLID